MREIRSCVASVTVFLVLATAWHAQAALIDAGAIARDRRVEWFPAPRATLFRAGHGAGRSVESRGVILRAGDSLRLEVASPEELRERSWQRRSPEPYFLRIDEKRAGADVAVFRFDPLAESRTLVREQPAFQQENRLYFAPPPFPGQVAYIVTGQGEFDCSFSRVARFRSHWEEIEKAAREALECRPGQDSRLERLLRSGEREASDFAWRQAALLPWPAAPSMPEAERQLRRAAFFLGAYEARAGEAEAMDPFPVSAVSMQGGAARIDGQDYRVLARGQQAVLEVSTPGVLRVASRALYPADAGDPVLRYRLELEMDGYRTQLAVTDTFPDDDGGMRRAPSGHPVGKERIAYQLVPPGRHRVTVRTGAPVLIRFDLERERQGLGDSSLEDPTSALDRCLILTDMTTMSSPSARELLARAAALALVNDLDGSAAAARKALDAPGGDSGVMAAAALMLGSEADRGHGELDEAASMLRRALALLSRMPAGLLRTAMLREARRRLARVEADAGRYGEAAAVLATTLEELPEDARTRLQQARCLGLESPIPGSRSGAWPQADRASLDARLEPRSTIARDSLWGAVSEWSELPPATGLTGPGQVLLCRLEPVRPGPAARELGADPPFMDTAEPGVLYAVQPSHQVVVPAGPEGVSAWPLLIVADRPAGVRLDGHPVPGRMEQGRWLARVETRPGLHTVEFEAGARVYTSAPSAQSVAAWKAGMSNLERWTLGTYFPVGASPESALVYRPEPGPWPGAVRILAQPTGQEKTRRLIVAIDGQGRRELVLPDCPAAGTPFEAWLPLPAGSPGVRIYSAGGTCLVRVSERTSRARPPEFPAPAGPLSPEAPSLAPIARAAGFAPALLRTVLDGLAIQPRVDARWPVVDPLDAAGALASLTAGLHGTGGSKALLNLARGRYAEAIGLRRHAQADYLRAMSDESSAPEVRVSAREGFHRTLVDQGNLDEAWAGMVGLAREGYDHVRLRLDAARAALTAREERSALAVLEPLAKQHPSHPAVGALLAETLVLLGRPQEALDRTVSFARGQGGRVDRESLEYTRAVAMARAGKLAEAREAFERLARSATPERARAAGERAAELELLDGGDGCELSLARATWFERSSSRRRTLRSGAVVLGWGDRIRPAIRGASQLVPVYRPGRGKPVRIEISGPTLVKLEIAADTPDGSAGWKLAIDGREIEREKLRDVAPSGEIVYPGIAGIVPGEPEVRTVEIPEGTHVLTVTGDPGTFTVHPVVVAPGFDDLLATGNLEPGARCPEVAAQQLAAAGRWTEASRALGDASGIRALLLRARISVALGEASTARAALARLPRRLRPYQALQAARVHVALAGGDPAKATGAAWADLQAALGIYEELLEDNPASGEAEGGRRRIVRHLAWRPVAGVDAAAGVEMVRTPGLREIGPLAAVLRQAHSYSPWGPQTTLGLSENRLELQLETDGPTGLAIECFAERPAKGREPEAPAGSAARLIVVVDGVRQSDWRAPLGAVSRRAVSLDGKGPHLVEIGLDDPAQRTQAALRVLIDRPVSIRDKRMELGPRTPGKWHPLPPSRLDQFFVAAQGQPVEVTLQGPFVGRVYVRGLIGPGVSPASSVTISAGSFRETLAVPSAVDRSSAPLERTSAAVSEEALAIVNVASASRQKLRVEPVAGSALVRIEMPGPRPEPPAGSATAVARAVAAAGEAIVYAMAAPVGPARYLPAEMADMLGHALHERGTWRYRARFVEGLRPDVDEFRLERHTDLGVAYYERTPEGSVMRGWEADTRIRVEGPVAQVAGYRYEYLEPSNGGRLLQSRDLIRGAARLIGQEVSGSLEAAIRADFYYGKLRDLTPRLQNLPEVGLELYAATIAGPGATPVAEIDSELFTRFDRDHRAGLVLQDTLTWSPFTDAQIYARGRVVTNANLLVTDLDRASVRVGARRQMGHVEADASYTRTERFEDDDRPRALQDDDFSAKLSYWDWRDEETFVVPAIEATYRERFDEWLIGVSVSLTGDRGQMLEDLPHGSTAFEAAKRRENPAAR